MQGLHLTADLRGCPVETRMLSDAAALRDCYMAALTVAHLHPVGELFHFVPAGAQRGVAAPSGVTGVVLLAESHLAVHTWPELGAVTLDVYVCNVSADNSARAALLLECLIAAFSPSDVERHTLQRGRFASNGESA